MQWWVFVEVGWDAYVVMHTLVLRVPLLMVVPLALQSLLIAAALQLGLTKLGHPKCHDFGDPFSQ